MNLTRPIAAFAVLLTAAGGDTEIALLPAVQSAREVAP